MDDLAGWLNGQSRSGCPLYRIVVIELPCKVMILYRVTHLEVTVQSVDYEGAVSKAHCIGPFELCLKKEVVLPSRPGFGNHHARHNHLLLCDLLEILTAFVVVTLRVSTNMNQRLTTISTDCAYPMYAFHNSSIYPSSLAASVAGVMARGEVEGIAIGVGGSSDMVVKRQPHQCSTVMITL